MFRKSILLLAAGGLFAVSGLAAAPQKFPSCNELRSMIRKDHPRLFITRADLPAFKVRANTVCKPYLEQFQKEVDAAPDVPRLAPNPDTAEFKDNKISVIRHRGNQDNASYYVDKSSMYGNVALKAAIVYLAGGGDRYLRKASAYLEHYSDLTNLARRSKMMLEWYHTDRYAAVTAYDWLYNELDPKVRTKFMTELLEYSDHLLDPGYHINGGWDFDFGNYGERGALWPICIAAEHDGFDGARLNKLWDISYQNNVGCMQRREVYSAGTGLLTNVCTGYSFGMYPFSSFNFLHILKSAAGIDGTKHFPQMSDYAEYFNWQAIPISDLEVPSTFPGSDSRRVQRDAGANGPFTGFCEFGWGDSYHISNAMPLELLYVHMAQLIHFFGQSSPERAAVARATIERLPARFRRLGAVGSYPYLPFILTGFDPDIKNPEPPSFYLAKAAGMFYPSFGTTVMRSGTGTGDTYAAFKGGSTSRAHSHYDELSFIIYKNGFQALDSGRRDRFPHHWAYYPRTVAHNSLLIRMEKEPMPGYWYPANAEKFDKQGIFNDGGQNAMGKAKSLGFSVTERYVITGGDAAACYTDQKCKEAIRQFVYIKPDYFVIYDRVESVKPDQEKVFLLHTQEKPEMVNGIWHSTAGKGALFTRTLLPENARCTVIGGPGKEFWTNGKNYSGWEELLKKPNWLGQYRMEISDPKAGTSVRFLHVLQASSLAEKAMIPVKRLRDEARDGAELTLPNGEKVQVWFNRTGKADAAVRFVK